MSARAQSPQLVLKASSVVEDELPYDACLCELSLSELSILLWGKAYADKLTSMTLPALLAPGNLPALCAMFNVEVVIVTETKLFDVIRDARARFNVLALLCPVTLISDR